MIPFPPICIAVSETLPPPGLCWLIYMSGRTSRLPISACPKMFYPNAETRSKSRLSLFACKTGIVWLVCTTRRRSNCGSWL